MSRQSVQLITTLALAFLLGSPGLASAQTGNGKKAPKAQARTGDRKPRPKLVCSGKGKARKCHRVRGSKITNHAVRDDELRAGPLARPSGWVDVYVPAYDKELKINIYNDDGSYNMAALAQLDELWVCKKTHEVRAVEPRLYEVMSMLYDHYGQRIELLSGFRFQRNEGSRHFHASAMDVRVPGVNYKELYTFAQTLDPGGMGVGEYPNMGFVHIDFRAPGERSVRWTDTAHGVDGSDPGKLPSRDWKPSRGPDS